MLLGDRASFSFFPPLGDPLSSRPTQASAAVANGLLFPSWCSGRAVDPVIRAVIGAAVRVRRRHVFWPAGAAEVTRRVTGSAEASFPAWMQGGRREDRNWRLLPLPVRCRCTMGVRKRLIKPQVRSCTPEMEDSASAAVGTGTGASKAQVGAAV